MQPSSNIQTASKPDENWEPVPYTERKSQNLAFSDYFKRVLFHLLVGGASGSAAGWAIDRARSQNHVNHGFTSFKYWGGVIGFFVGGYFNWKPYEAMRLQTEQVLQEYKDLPGLLQTNNELAHDNAILKRITAHQRDELQHPQKNEIRTNEAELHGAVTSAPHRNIS